jgi:predicted TIM-barrel fold metal-dependent hydrolase
MSVRVLVIAVAMLALALPTACPDQATAPPIETSRKIASLEAEVAMLQRQLTGGRREERFAGLINAHEHLYRLDDLERYLPAARQAGIAKTVLVASPEFTLKGKGDKGEPMMSENFQTILLAARRYPDEIVPFCTIDPHDPKRLERLQGHVAAGAQGVKIYSGHSNFYDKPLDDPAMDPVWSYLEETGLPINWHINLAKFMPEFAAVLKRHPRLNVMVPHYGVVFWRPKSGSMARLRALLKEHPGFLIDTSLGTREILIDGMAAIEPARETFQTLFAEFPDQIVWGTDSVITGNPEKTTSWFDKVIWATRDHLEQDTFTTELAAGYSRYHKKGRDADGRYLGLALPPEILQKVYVDNARRWLRLPPAAPPASPPASP